VAPGRRIVWSEMVPYPEIRDPALLACLAARGIDLMVAVRPGTLEDAPAVVAACRTAGVGVGLWPMLDDDDGRWLSAANAARFSELACGLAAAAGPGGEIAIDLEPPIDRVHGILAGRPTALWRSPPRSNGVLSALIDELRSRRLRVHAAVTLVETLPSAAASRGWQRLFGTRLEDGACDLVNTMVYTSLIEGYARGTLRRRDARALLAALAAAAARRHQDRAAVSLGAVGIGALGDEQPYRAPSELADDVALVRGAGIAHLGLFGLGGILARPPIERWLDAFCVATAAPAPPLTARARLALAAATALGRAAAWKVPRRSRAADPH
jgi:hypothetical protein